MAIVGNVANNHAHDAGDAGRDTTIALLGAAGIFVTGADTIATPVALPSGDTIGVLGFYTDTTRRTRATCRAVRRHVARAVEQLRHRHRHHAPRRRRAAGAANAQRQ